jgi:hypothetical protein
VKRWSVEIVKDDPWKGCSLTRLVKADEFSQLSIEMVHNRAKFGVVVGNPATQVKDIAVVIFTEFLQPIEEIAGPIASQHGEFFWEWFGIIPHLVTSHVQEATYHVDVPLLRLNREPVYVVAALQDVPDRGDEVRHFVTGIP